MTAEISQQVSQHPFVAILVSWIGSGFLSALISGMYSLRSNRNAYVNDYYKYVIERRIQAYESLESTIKALQIAVSDGKDDRLYHAPFSSEEEKDWHRNVVELTQPLSQGMVK